MKKPKYSLSKSGMDSLMNTLEKIAQEGKETTVEGLLEAQITTNFVKVMTKVSGIEDVIERNDTLTKHFTGFLGMYGFESMYDMYLYAMSCDIVPEQIMKRKDYSRLVPVKRKIIRNGKETEVTVYEDPNKDSKDNSSGSSSNSGNTKGSKGQSRGQKARHVRDLTSTIVGDKETANPKTIANLKVAAKSLPKGDKPFQESSQFFLTVKDEDSAIIGIVGYSIQGDFLVMDFYRSDGTVAGVAAKGFFSLLKLALEKNKGVKVEDNQQARPVFMQSGLTQEEAYWVISNEDLRAALGESGSKNE
jgi:hypothetical protein